jgi:hypothetical protein
MKSLLKKDSILDLTFLSLKDSHFRRAEFFPPVP